MNTQSREFRYEHPTSSLVLMIVVAWVIPLLCAKLASGNSLGRSLLGGLIHLSPTVLWGFSGISAIAACGATITAINNMRAQKFVSLSQSFTVVPRASLLGGQLTIPYEKISKIEQRIAPNNQKMIVINSSLGQSRLLSSGFDAYLDFNTFYTELQQRVNA
jgi:hypothetical protein